MPRDTEHMAQARPQGGSLRMRSVLVQVGKCFLSMCFGQAAIEAAAVAEAVAEAELRGGATCGLGIHGLMENAP